MEESKKIRRMSYAAVLAALTGAGALLSVPLGPVPFTLQTFFVLLAGFLLGAKWGFVAVTLYLLLGVAGLPVFAGGSAGAGVILGPTGGYLLSFPFGAAAAGFLAEIGDGRSGVERISLKAAGGAVGSALILVVGAVRLMGFFGMSPAAAFAAGIAPFVATSFIEIGLAVGLSESLSRAGVVSASEGPRVRGVEERALYAVALGAGLFASVLIPWAHLSEEVTHEGEAVEATAGAPGYFTGGELALVDDEAVVEATATVPSVVTNGASTVVVGVAGVVLAVAAVKGVDESYVAAGYGVVGMTAAGVTAFSYLNVSSWSLGVEHSVGYGVYLPALMGLGYVVLAVHSLRVVEASPEAAEAGT